MKIKPTTYSQASETTRKIYDHIQNSLEIKSVPLFFQFLGSFPEYLEYLSSALISNFQHEKFKHLVRNNLEFSTSVFRENFPPSLLQTEFLEKYQYHPQIKNMQQEIEKLLNVNAKMAFYFLALRESLKGWAIAARKLPSQIQESLETRNQTNSTLKEELIYNRDLLAKEEPDELANNETAIIKTDSTLEVNLFAKYLSLSEMEFQELLKQETLLYFRVELEKIILKNLDFLPQPIFSPINIVLKLTKAYPDFPDLLFLLSETFPTYAIQRYLFNLTMLY